ncbi:hypothetical protein L3X38_037970 [Prunus dulcis]|uniref:Uncharacterized protein n=1 Tax=Prunus dulcis TaxID=3755 RepID=A0AAD4YQ20_PRUDU|nr:hypothetical protein L3X38_037970 [Prunus dulcis]
MAAGGGRSAAAKFGRHSGENRRFPAAGAAADLGGGLGRDAEAEPAALPTRCSEGKVRKDHFYRIVIIIDLSRLRSISDSDERSLLKRAHKRGDSQVLSISTERMNFHTLIARNGGRRREIGGGEVRATFGRKSPFSGGWSGGRSRGRAGS